MRGGHRSGLTLVELVVAALVLQLGLLSALSVATLASAVTRRAAATERIVSVLAGVADSLAALDSLTSDSTRVSGVDVLWTSIPPSAELRASAEGADTVRLRIRTARRPRVP